VAAPEPAEQKIVPVAPIVELRVHPYATVFVDGERLGVTPLGRLKLRPGRHTLKLVNDTIPRTKEIILDVKAGADSSLGVNLLEE
jgi:serine/threonine-protein kinase